MPERFRGGCSFGAATLAALKALPIEVVGTSNCSGRAGLPAGTPQLVDFVLAMKAHLDNGEQQTG